MTDFGKILDEWDGIRASGKNRRTDSDNNFARLVDGYLPRTKSVPEEKSELPPVSKAKIHPRNWPIDATLDLHGKTRIEANDALDALFSEAVKRNFRKLLIIHGKGNHSTNGAVLKTLVGEFLDAHPKAGMRGYPDRKNGGSGAVWVVIK